MPKRGPDGFAYGQCDRILDINELSQELEENSIMPMVQGVQALSSYLDGGILPSQMTGYCNVERSPYTLPRNRTDEDYTQGMHSVHYGQPPIVESAAVKIEQIREKNRQAQARHRKKLRDKCAQLEAQVDNVLAAVTAAKACQAQRLQRKDELLTRCSRAAAALDATLKVVRDVFSANPGARISAQATSDLSTDELELPSERLLGCTTASRSCRGIASGPAGRTRPREARPLESFTLCQQFSVDSFLSKRDDSTVNIHHMMETFKVDMASKKGLHPQNVAWFANLGYEVTPNMPLTCSSSLSSPQCIVSLIFSHIMLLFESALFATVNKQGDKDYGESPSGTSGPGSPSPKRARTSAQSSVNHAQNPSSPPKPSNGVQNSPVAAFRCGSKQTAPIQASVRNVLRSVVAQYAHCIALPDLKHILHRLRVVSKRQLEGVMQPPSGSPLASIWKKHVAKPCPTVEQPEPENTFENDLIGSLAVLSSALDQEIESAASNVSALLREIAAKTDKTPEPTTHALGVRFRRAFLSISVAEIAAASDATPLFFGLMNALISSFQDEIFMVDALHVRTASSLNLSEEQRSMLSNMWQALVSKKSKHDELMNAARKEFRELPCEIPVPVQFLQHITALCKGGKVVDSFSPIVTRGGMASKGWLRDCGTSSGGMSFASEWHSKSASTDMSGVYAGGNAGAERMKAGLLADLDMMGWDTGCGSEWGDKAEESGGLALFGQGFGMRAKGESVVDKLEEVSNNELELYMGKYNWKLNDSLMDPLNLSMVVSGALWNNSVRAQFCGVLQHVASRQNRENLFLKPII